MNDTMISSLAHAPFDPEQPLALLGGISPAVFMRHYWQKKPLLVRQAIPGFESFFDVTALQALAADEAVESRLLQAAGEDWDLQTGPFAQFPPLTQPHWTVLLQGMELHDARVRALLDQFRFLPDARLDDLMISCASEGGGVGPHFDSYDVFLLQAAGRRRWSVSAQKDLRLKPDLPLKILQDFQAEETWDLAPGDMLYLPPSYAHDGVALDAGCQTYSIGFYAPKRNELVASLLQRLAEIACDELEDEGLYCDPRQQATAAPGRIPAALQHFARAGLAELLEQPTLLDEMLGEFLSEPKATVVFTPGEPVAADWQHYRLAAASRLLFDAATVYCNGESWHVAGQDAEQLQALANCRAMTRAEFAAASPELQALLETWLEAGWAYAH